MINHDTVSFWKQPYPYIRSDFQIVTMIAPVTRWHTTKKGKAIGLPLQRKKRAIVHIPVFRALYLWKSTAFSFVATPSCLPW